MTRMAHSPMWFEATAFAARAHADQIRKDRRTPYVAHCVRVAMTVAVTFGCTDETVLAAALLHDVIEDTGADYDDLLARFGRPIADLVATMTKDMRMIEPQREDAYDRQLADGPWQARLIKLADVLDNLLDAADDTSRRKLIGKARRALNLAQDDAELQVACAILRESVATIESSLPHA